MAQLRAYYYNGKDMMELVRFQKEKPSLQAAGAERDIILSTQMLRAEKNKNGELGKYVDILTHSVSLDTKKKVYFNEHIWGL